MSETDTKENPLVAKPVEESGLGAAMAGSGIFSDAASTLTDAQDPGWGLALDVGTDALDLLGAVMDPLSTLIGAGVGWLIEHIAFLREGLDKLAGNPGEITAKSVTWANISKQLTECADTYEKSAGTLAESHKGDSSTAYQATAKSYADTLRGASGHASEASTALTVGAALVGTERGLIRDLISSFISELIIKAIAALATSWCSFGASVAAFIADTVLEGSALAEKIGTKIAKVIEQLETLAKGAGKSKTAIEAAANGLKKIGKGVDKLADKGLNAAVKADSKAKDLAEAADKTKAAGAKTSEDLKEAFKAKTTDKALDGIDTAKNAIKSKLDIGDGTPSTPLKDVLTGEDSKIGQYSEPKRSTLSGEKWEESLEEAGEKGKAPEVPGWNRADTVGVAAESGRQINEQDSRQSETQEDYDREREAAEAAARRNGAED